jgi:surface carbohydrate biosynthesis protein
MVLKPNRKLILLPVETISRDLDFKLVLAGYLANEGNQVFIGNHTDIYEFGKCIKNGIYLGSNLLNVSPSRVKECYNNLKENKFRVLHLEEEGAIFSGGEKDWEKHLVQKFDPRWLESDDYTCAWGEFQARVYEKLNPKCIKNIKITGHPRFNLCHDVFLPIYQAEIDSIKKEHKRFILINTNFTRANFGTEIDYFFKKFKVEQNLSIKTDLVNEFCYVKQKIAFFIKLINRLNDELPNHKIILRPHPSEDLGIYNKILKYIPNAKIITAGSLIAWLRASEALIHCGCTTGIEGWLTNTFVINYQPIDEPRFERKIPNLVGYSCKTENEVLDYLKKIDIQGAFPNLKLDENSYLKIKSLIQNIGQSTESFEIVADLVRKLEVEVNSAFAIRSLFKFSLRGNKEKIKSLIRQRYSIFGKKYTPKNIYRYTRFPGLEPKSIDDKINFINKLTGKKIHAFYYSSKLMSLNV